MYPISWSIKFYQLIIVYNSMTRSDLLVGWISLVILCPLLEISWFVPFLLHLNTFIGTASAEGEGLCAACSEGEYAAAGVCEDCPAGHL